MTTTYANIAALRANTLTTVNQCFVFDYSTLGAGGGGYFDVAAGSALADNGGTVIVDAAGQRWCRDCADGFVTPLMFGALPNTYADAATPLQNWLNFLAGGASPVTGANYVGYWPAGVWVTSKTLTINFANSATPFYLFGSKSGTAINAIQVSFTGTLTSGSATISAVSSTANLAVGQALIGANIPSGTTISAISGSTITMSAKATASATAEAIMMTPFPAVISINPATDWFNNAFFLGGFNIGVEGGSIVPGQIGFQLNGDTAGIRLEDIIVSGMDTGFWLNGPQFSTFARLNAFQCNVGVHLYCDVANGGGNSNTFYDLASTSNLIGLVMDGVENINANIFINPLINNNSICAVSTNNAGARLVNLTMEQNCNGRALTGSTTSGSTTISSMSSVVGLVAGQAISGAGIPAGATIATVTAATAKITISAAATATASGVALSVPSYSYNGNLIQASTLQSVSSNIVFQDYYNETGWGPVILSSGSSLTIDGGSGCYSDYNGSDLWTVDASSSVAFSAAPFVNATSGSASTVFTKAPAVFTSGNANPNLSISVPARTLAPWLPNIATGLVGAQVVTGFNNYGGVTAAGAYVNDATMGPVMQYKFTAAGQVAGMNFTNSTLTAGIIACGLLVKSSSASAVWTLSMSDEVNGNLQIPVAGEWYLLNMSGYLEYPTLGFYLTVTQESAASSGSPVTLEICQVMAVAGIDNRTLQRFSQEGLYNPGLQTGLLVGPQTPGSLCTYANLPAIASVSFGTRAVISDSTVSAFGSSVTVGGGSIHVPVWADTVAGHWVVG